MVSKRFIMGLTSKHIQTYKWEYRGIVMGYQPVNLGWVYVSAEKSIAIGFYEEPHHFRVA